MSGPWLPSCPQVPLLVGWDQGALVNAGKADMTHLAGEAVGLCSSDGETVAFSRHFLCGVPEFLAAIFVFYCSLTNYYNLSSLKHHPLTSSPFRRSEAQAAASAPGPTKSHSGWGRALTREIRWKNQLPRPFRLLAEPSSMQLED